MTVNLTPRGIRSLFRRTDPSIRIRLIACFVLIVLLMIVVDVIAAWQFRQIAAAAQRLGTVNEAYLAVMRVHFGVATFRDHMDALTSNHDARQFASEAASIRQKFVEHVDYAEQTLRTTLNIEPGSPFFAALESLRVTMLSQLDSAVELADAGDWNSVRLRLASQIPALVEFSSSLVERVDQQVLQQRTQAIEDTERAERRLLVIVPLAALLTLLAATALGWYVTWTVTAPLSELTAGAEALARGNFQNQVNLRGHDELAVLGKAFNYAARQLRQLYEDLRRSEQELREVIETIPAVAWSALPDGSNAFVNSRWTEYTGLSSQQTAGSGWQAAIHPEDVQQHLDRWRASVATGQPFEIEVRLRRADGRYRWHLFSGLPLREKHGDILKWYGIATDIEDRKQAEALLAGANRILKLAAAGDPLPDILHSLCRLIEEQASDVLASVLLLDGNRLRHGAAPALPKTYTDAIDGAAVEPSAIFGGTADHSEAVIVEDIANGPLWAPYRDLALHHGLRACWSTPVFSSQQKIIATFVMYYREPRCPSRCDQETIAQIGDLAGVVIERKLTQEALRRSEAYLAEAQYLANLGSWAWRVQGREAVHLSDQWYRIYEFNPEGGVPSWEQRLERIHPDDRATWRDAVERALMEKSDYDVEYRILLPTGRIKFLHTVGHPVTNSSGDLVEFVGISTDITERKRAEEERERLRQLEIDLARMNRVSMMGELAASLAHEIKQPISAVMLDAGTCLEWLQRNPPEIDEARQAVSRVTRGITRASEIINRVHSLFKKEEPQRESIDLNEIIQEMIVLLRGEAVRHLISINTELAANLPKINADRIQLQQVFMNLILNAIDAIKDTDGAGRLTIKTRHSSGGQLLISVRDTGVGIPPEQAGKIFEAFFTTKPQGSGMGLSISRSIIESHGGRLWVTANSGPGVTFQFTLPSEVGET